MLSPLRVTRSHFRPLLVIVVISLIIFIPLAIIYFQKDNAQAARKEDWVAGNIISDGEFTNSGSMSANDIQAFLDDKINGCDVWGTGRATEYNYNGTRAQYAASRGWPAPPYTCLNQYYEVPKLNPGGTMPANNYGNPNSRPGGSQSAAWIIKDAASRYRINPKVLLVKIATESAGPLTSDKWPFIHQYRYAMGAQCPDSGPNGSANCDPAYAGFSIQMYEAARLLRVYLDNMDQPWYGFMENGQKTQHPANRCGGSNPGEGIKVPGTTNCILWNVKQRGCGAQNIFIESKATAALYTYTPYQPNQAALSNMYGSGDGCSAYGNRNFWSAYWDWFGNTRGGHTIVSQLQDRYYALDPTVAALGRATDGGYCSPDKTTCWQGFTNGVLIYNSATGTWESRGGIRERWAQTGYQAGTLGFPITGENWDGRGWWQGYQNGAIIGTPSTGFWESINPIRERWAQTGYQNGFMGYPTGPVVVTVDKSASWQQYEHGVFIWGKDTGTWESKGGIRDYWAKMGYQTGKLGFPTSPEMWNGRGWWQGYQNGAIIGTPSTGFWESTGPTRAKWAQLGYENSALGYPTTPVLCGLKSSGCFQNYERGAIVGTTATGYFESRGGIRAKWAQLGYENSALGYPTSDEMCDEVACRQTYQGGVITWTRATNTTTYVRN